MFCDGFYFCVCVCFFLVFKSRACSFILSSECFISVVIKPQPSKFLANIIHFEIICLFVFSLHFQILFFQLSHFICLFLSIFLINSRYETKTYTNSKLNNKISLFFYVFHSKIINPNTRQITYFIVLFFIY